MDIPLTVNVVIAYQHLEAGIQAMQITQRLAGRLSPAVTLQNEAWKFDLIETPHLRDLADRAIQQANMLIVAGHADEKPPENIRQWIERWALSQHSEPVALVGLDHPVKDRVNARADLRNYLRSVAEAAGLDFFWHGAPQEPGPFWEGQTIRAWDGIDGSPVSEHA